MQLKGAFLWDDRKKDQWCIKGTEESFPGLDSLVSLMHSHPSNLGSMILLQIILKKCMENNAAQVEKLSSKTYTNLNQGNAPNH